jgi:FtsP/CotA-like multicopper oxidase with cupredoxin domain
VQKNFLGSTDPDAGARRDLRFPPPFAVNGALDPSVISMRPGAVERWRVLNGGVDGSSMIRFMVLEGQYVFRESRLWRVVTEGVGSERTRRAEPVTQQEIEDAKLDLHQLAFDGITLVTGPPEPGEDELRSLLRAYEDCFKDGDAVRHAFVRPNELFLGNANRADVFFKAPRQLAGKMLTILALEAHIHSDSLPRQLQRLIGGPPTTPRRPLVDVVLGYIHVQDNPVEDADFDVQSLRDHLPPVPPLLQPIKEDELRVPAEEARRTGVPVGSARTRVIGYTGTGGADFPRVVVPEPFVRSHPELEGLVWGMHQGVAVLLPNLTRTMGIVSDLDLGRKQEPDLPRKFMPEDPKRSRVLVNTAEEWVLYNSSQTLWSHTDRKRYPQPGSYAGHFDSYPITVAEGRRRFWQDPEFRISSKGVDHPFHIHINPMWVLRIDVPDENGDLHNILPEPRWMDTAPIPRNGGRVVFRTRFDDFVGTWVHHCHILLHEDMGMMQVVECTDRAEDVNYHVREVVASADMEAAAVDAIYPRLGRELMYWLNMCFEDPNEIGYQVYPGFDFEVPKLED